MTITSSYNGCFEEPPAPIAVRLAVTSSEEDLDRLVVECTHNRLVPSSAAQCRGPFGVDQGKADGRKCSVALGVFGADGCGIVAAIRS